MSSEAKSSLDIFVHLQIYMSPMILIFVAKILTDLLIRYTIMYTDKNELGPEGDQGSEKN